MAEAKLTILIQAQEQASASLKSVGSELSNLAKTAAAFTLGNLGTQLTGDLAEQFKSVLTETQAFGEQIYKLQAQIGGSAESLSGLIGAFEKLGNVGADQAGSALTRFNRSLRGQVDITEQGAESGKTFNGVLSELGVTAVDASGHFRPMTDVLNDVMDAEQRMSAEGRAGADAMVLFGRGVGLSLAPMLLLGSAAFKEAEQTAKNLGLQLTSGNVESIHNFTLRQKEMNEALAGLKLEVGVQLMTPLAELAGLISDIAVHSNAAGGSLLKDIGTAAEDAIAKIRELNRLRMELNDRAAQAQKNNPDLQGPGGLGETGAAARRQLLWDQTFGRAEKERQDRIAALNADLAAAGAPAISDSTSLQRQTTFGQDAREARATQAATFAATTLADKQNAANQQELAAKRALEIIGQEVNVAQRQNLDLVIQEAQAQAGMIPMKQQQAEIALDIMRTENQRASIARQTAVDQARLASQPSSRALEDNQYKQQLLEAQIDAGILSGKGMPAGAIPALIALQRGEAGLKVDALLGQAPVTAASRAADTGGLKASISTADLRMDAADLALKVASTQLDIDRIHGLIEKDRLAAAVVIADLEAARRKAEDAAFSAGQKKQELSPVIQSPTFHLEQHITSTGDVDYERIKNDAIAGMTMLITKSVAAFAPAPQDGVPGAAY